MIIDNPQIMREVVRETHAHFTHPGAEEIYTTYKDKMDAYAARWGRLADRIWEEEYNNGQPSTEEDKSGVAAGADREASATARVA